MTVLALALAAAAAERVSVRLTTTTELSISGIPALCCCSLWPASRWSRGSRINARRSRARIAPRSRSRASSQMGDVYEHSLHDRRRNRTRRAGDDTACTVAVRRACGSDTSRDAPEGTPRSRLRGADGSGTWRIRRRILHAWLAPLLLAHRQPMRQSSLSLRSCTWRFPWTLALFLVPALAAQRLYGLYQGERQLAADLSTANETLERANLQFAAALIATLDARDRYTAGHSAAVAIYSRDIAERMCLPIETQEHAYLCGLVHDIGKIGLPPACFEKPGALTLEERRQMQEHSAIGERILGHVDEYSEIATVVRFHHERIDGQGYPDGLDGETIPLVSRIIAVADAYNAMTSDRPYRDAMPSRVARLRLAQAVDSQFDTSVVAAFEAILAGADEEYRLAKRQDFLEFAQSTYDSGSDSRSRSRKSPDQPARTRPAQADCSP